MMPEISLNILDVAENSIRAKADLIEIEVAVDTKRDMLSVMIKDNGCGMSEEKAKKVTDPFYTTRTTRKVGLGIPFFKQAALDTGGSFEIRSEEGAGTTVTAIFGLSHIDRMPLGDINATIHMLIIFNEPVEFRYKYVYNDRQFELDTREIKEILGNVSLKEAEVSRFIKEYLDENKAEADGGSII